MTVMFGLRGFSIGYDGMGNMTKDNLSNTYSYDAEGRPITINGTQATYDAFGRTVEVNGKQIVYGPSGNKFAYMSGQSLQQYIVPLTAGLQAVYNASGFQFGRYADWLGSSRLQLTWNGAMYGDRAYAPYGEAYAEAGTADRSFTGQTQDVIQGPTGMYDFLFRQYSPSQSRWIVPDPAGLAAVDLTNPQTWNRYAYVGNNPLINVDRLGLKIVPCSDGTDSGTICVDDSQPDDPNQNSNNGDRSLPPPKVDPVYWGNIGTYPGRIVGNLNQFNNGKWNCSRFGNGVWKCLGIAGRDNGHVVTAAPAQPQYKPNCYGPAVWAGVSAAAKDAIPVPSEQNPNPIDATGDYLTSKPSQAASIAVLYKVANGARPLTAFADAAADYVPVVGWLWAGYQGIRALAVGAQAYKESIDQCYGGG
jgi:RHS repeat-associated protein